MVNDSGLVVHLDAWQNQKQPHPKVVKTLKINSQSIPTDKLTKDKSSEQNITKHINHYLCLSVEFRASRNYRHKNQAPKYTR